MEVPDPALYDYGEGQQGDSIMVIKYRTPEAIIDLIQGGILVAGMCLLENNVLAARQALHKVDNLVMNLRGKSQSSAADADTMRAFAEAVVEDSIPLLDKTAYTGDE